MSAEPARLLLMNENIGGHATVHLHLRRIADGRDDVTVRIVDVPPPGFWRKVAGVAVPGLSRMDADLRPVRYQLAQSAWVARRLRGWIRDFRADVVHLYTQNAGLLAGRALRDTPYVVTTDSTNALSNLMHPVREPTRFSHASTPVVRPFERAVYRGARLVVANSRWCARSLTEDYQLPAERIRVLPMGVPLPPPTKPVPVPGCDLPRVVFVGRTLDGKGGRLLLDVHRRWLADRCELVLVTGEPVPPAENLQVLNDVRPGDGRLDALLARATVFALPSRLDQWPNAVMEAMAAGVPPVVCAVGGMPEMVLHGEAGVVLPDRSPEALRDAILGLLDDPARQQRLGTRARQRVEEDLDVERTGNALLDLLHDAARTPITCP